MMIFHLSFKKKRKKRNLKAYVIQLNECKQVITRHLIFTYSSFVNLADELLHDPSVMAQFNSVAGKLHQRTEGKRLSLTFP